MPSGVYNHNPSQGFQIGNNINKGKVFSISHRKNLSKNNWLKGKRMPEIIKKKVSESRRGKCMGSENNLWKGGITPINQKIRMSLEYRLWREAVFKRDNWTCVWCGTKGNTNADHIKSFALFPELRFAIDNGRTLCVPCHKKTDTYLNRWYATYNGTA